MELNEEQSLKRLENFIRLKGRTGVIDNPYFTKLNKGDKIYIHSYIQEKDVFKVLIPNTIHYEYCIRDEFNLIDKEFSDFKIIKKGIRTERNDKFKDRFIIELQNNERDIYLSEALLSLLNLKEEENYVGFATDPDTGKIYVFAADKSSGYLLNKANNRITSKADWREMFKIHEVMYFEVYPQPIIDNVNNPGFIFYTLNPCYDNFQGNNPQVQPQVKTKRRKEVEGGGIYKQMKSGKINKDFNPVAEDREFTTNKSLEEFYDEAINKKRNNWIQYMVTDTKIYTAPETSNIYFKGIDKTSEKIEDKLKDEF